MKYKESLCSRVVFCCRETNTKMKLFIKKLVKAWHNKRGYFDHYVCRHIRDKEFQQNSTVCVKEQTEIQSSVTGESLCVGEDRLAVYTCVFGGYDDVEEPFIRGKYCDYYIVSDREISKKSKWKKIEPKQYPDGFDMWHPAIKNRYLKMHPDVLFPDYKYSVYIDGNYRPITDLYPFLIQMKEKNAIIGLFDHPIWDCVYDMTDVLINIDLVNKENAKAQISRYLLDGFPKHWGLFECGFIIREHHNIKCKQIMNCWWNEYLNGEKRDQMCFSYALWKSGMKFLDVCNLGKNIRKSPRLKEKPHNRPHSKVKE